MVKDVLHLDARLICCVLGQKSSLVIGQRTEIVAINLKDNWPNL